MNNPGPTKVLARSLWHSASTVHRPSWHLLDKSRYFGAYENTLTVGVSFPRFSVFYLSASFWTLRFVTYGSSQREVAWFIWRPNIDTCAGCVSFRCYRVSGVGCRRVRGTKKPCKREHIEAHGKAHDVMNSSNTAEVPIGRPRGTKEPASMLADGSRWFVVC